MKSQYTFTSDLLFKKLLGSIGNEDVLEGTIELITNRRFTNMHPIQHYNIQTYKKERNEAVMGDLRATIVDVAATSAEGVDVIIEMQLHYYRELNERFLFYLCNKFIDNYPAKEDQARGRTPYSYLKPVILIVVGNYYLPNSNLIHDISQFKSLRLEGAWTDDYGRPLLEAHTFSLKGTELAPGDSLQLLNLQTFFKDGIISPDAPEFMRKGLRLLELENMTEEEKEMINREEQERANLISWQLHVIRESREEARKEITKEIKEELSKEAREEVFQTLVRQLSLTMTTEQIATALARPLPEIEAVLKD